MLPLERKSMEPLAASVARQQKTALRVANVDEDGFEAAVESDDPPTVTELGGQPPS